ncbi:MAG TPA: cytochrome B [Gammaproteobacteria bacterium]|nr:cytochrome B [Gammaproteobacteria bacterium]
MTKIRKTKKVKVWDLLIRFFHWVLVVAFFIAYVSGEEESGLHIYSGYVVLSLISLRVLWGFIGTKYARFNNFVHGKDVVFRYLKSMISGNPEHYTGHNPAGGWMVMALILSLFVTTISGLQVYALEEGAGPLANISIETDVQLVSAAIADDHDKEQTHEGIENEADEFWEEFWEEVHEVAANLTLLLIFMHVAGVYVSSRLHRENLVKAMITGYKKAG